MHGRKKKNNGNDITGFYSLHSSGDATACYQQLHPRSNLTDSFKIVENHFTV